MSYIIFDCTQEFTLVIADLTNNNDYIYIYVCVCVFVCM